MVRRTTAVLLREEIDQRKAEKRRLGIRRHEWVYVIHWQDRGPTKVGIANSPRARLSELQVGNPFVLKLFTAFGFVQRGHALEIEGAVLRGLRGCAMSGEWMNATPLQVRDKIQECATRAGLTFVPWDHDYKRPPSLDKRRAMDAMAEYRRLRED